MLGRKGTRNKKYDIRHFVCHIRILVSFYFILNVQIAFGAEPETLCHLNGRNVTNWFDRRTERGLSTHTVAQRIHTRNFRWYPFHTLAYWLWCSFGIPFPYVAIPQNYFILSSNHSLYSISHSLLVCSRLHVVHIRFVAIPIAENVVSVKAIMDAKFRDKTK